MGLGPQRKDSKTFGTLTHPRYHLACAQIKHSNGSNFIIAVGGKYRDEDSHGVSLDTTEILNVDLVSNSWSPGKTS